MAIVTECDAPSNSGLSSSLIEGAYFHDSYRAPLSRTDLGIVGIFFALFGHMPLSVKLLLVVRNVAAKLVGLETPTIAEIMSPQVRSKYAIGETIGPWPIYSITENEIIAGRNNKHMDFRLSVLKSADAPASSSPRCARSIICSGKSICSSLSRSTGAAFFR